MRERWRFSALDKLVLDRQTDWRPELLTEIQKIQKGDFFTDGGWLGVVKVGHSNVLFIRIVPLLLTIHHTDLTCPHLPPQQPGIIHTLKWNYSYKSNTFLDPLGAQGVAISVRLSIRHSHKLYQRLDSSFVSDPVYIRYLFAKILIRARSQRSIRTYSTLCLVLLSSPLVEVSTHPWLLINSPNLWSRAETKIA